MRYMLDTNIIAQLVNVKSPYHQATRGCLLKLKKTDVCISVLTECEIRQGVLGIDKRKAKYLERIEQSVEFVLGHIETLSFTKEASHYYGQIRAYLTAKGQDIGAMDALIAAHTLAENCALVTHNQKHFLRVKKV